MLKKERNKKERRGEGEAYQHLDEIYLFCWNTLLILVSALPHLPFRRSPFSIFPSSFCSSPPTFSFSLSHPLHLFNHSCFSFPFFSVCFSLTPVFVAVFSTPLPLSLSLSPLFSLFSSSFSLGHPDSREISHFGALSS